MKKLFAIICVLFVLCTITPGQFHSVKDGDWRVASTWSTDPNATAYPDSTSTVSVSHYVVVSSSGYYPSECNNLTIEVGGVIDAYTSAAVGGSLTVRNNLINNGTISPSYDFWLEVGGNLYNNGIITKHYISQYQRLYIMGNIYNNGSFHFTHTSFTNMNYTPNTTEHLHYIKSMNDSTLYLGETSFIDSLGAIVIDSIAILNGTINLNKSKVILPTEVTHPNTLILDNATIYGGIIEANKNTISTNGTLAYLGYIYAQQTPNLVLVNANLVGRFLSGGEPTDNGNASLVIFEGETNLDGGLADWYNGSIWYNGDRGIFIDGTFTNNGNIYDATTDKGLFLNQKNNSTFISNGTVNNKAIVFSGICNFSVSDSLSATQFKATDSNTVVNVSGDIFFKKTVTVDFNGGTLNLSNDSDFYTTYQWFSRLKNININVNGANIKFASVAENVRLNNPNVAGGIYYINNSVLSGEVVVSETGALFPYADYSPHIIVDGNINNYGRIENHPTSGSLYLEVTGNIMHDGTSWKNIETKLNGMQDQSIMIPNDSSWTGKVILDAMLDGTTYQWQKDGVDISGANSKTLNFNSGLSSASYGQYYCQTSAGNSRIITISGGSQPVVLLEQKFDSAEEVADWTIIPKINDKTWILGNIVDNEFTKIDPTNIYSAICPYDANNEQDEFIVTPQFAIGDGESTLEFYVGYNSQWITNANIKLMLVTNNDQNWDQIWEYNFTTNGWQWNKVEVDLTPYSNDNNIKLAWEYTGKDGDYVAIDNVKVTGFKYVTSIENETKTSLPKDYQLSQNYPNPFNPSTVIEFAIPQKENVNLTVFNSIGEVVAELINAEMIAGYHSVNFNATNLSSGIYFYRITTSNFTQSKKMILIK